MNKPPVRCIPRHIQQCIPDIFQRLCEQASRVTYSTAPHRRIISENDDVIKDLGVFIWLAWQGLSLLTLWSLHCTQLGYKMKPLESRENRSLCQAPTGKENRIFSWKNESRYSSVPVDFVSSPSSNSNLARSEEWIAVTEKWGAIAGQSCAKKNITIIKIIWCVVHSVLQNKPMSSGKQKIKSSMVCHP